MGGVRASWDRANNFRAIRWGKGALRVRDGGKKPQGSRPALERSLPEVAGSFGEVGGTAEVAPVVFVGGEGEDFFSLAGKAKVGVDDRKGAFFGEQREEAWGNNVDAGESESKR